MVFREGEVVKCLVDFIRKASGDGLSISGFRASVRHGGNERDYVWLFFCRPRLFFLWRGTSLISGCLTLPGRLLRVERRGRGLRVRGFGGLVVEFIVFEGAAGGVRRISNG